MSEYLTVRKTSVIYISSWLSNETLISPYQTLLPKNLKKSLKHCKVNHKFLEGSKLRMLRSLRSNLGPTLITWSLNAGFWMRQIVRSLSPWSESTTTPWRIFVCIWGHTHPCFLISTSKLCTSTFYKNWDYLRKKPQISWGISLSNLWFNWLSGDIPHNQPGKAQKDFWSKMDKPFCHQQKNQRSLQSTTLYESSLQRCSHHSIKITSQTPLKSDSSCCGAKM